MIKSNYIALLDRYGVDSKSKEALWSEIETSYAKTNRHYHNLTHLADIHQQLTSVKDKIEHWDILLFTLYYHDIIYKSTKKDNEEKSAELAKLRMTAIGVQKEDIQLCFEQIIATKSHRAHPNSDTNFFTDADLSILGRQPDIYKNYCSNIRKEYSIYPNFLYNRGRKKVIHHFLSMNKIFKTEAFFDRFEAQARINLRQELATLR